jgi:plastocyanin
MSSKRFLTFSLVVALVFMTTPFVVPMIPPHSGANDSSAYAQSNPADPTFFIIIPPGASEEGIPHYEPQDAAVPAGTTVVWINQDLVHHTVTSGTPDQPDKGLYFDSGEMPFNRKYQLTFDESSGLIGEFPYYCTLHPWIVGTISANDAVVTGQNFEFRSGTGSTLNLTENSRTLLAFTPIGIQVNQENPFSYNFTIIRDSDNKTVFTRNFDVENNDFEVELIDFEGSGEQEPTQPPITFGPEVGIPYTGAYHIAGDIAQTGNYTLAVELNRLGATEPEQPVREEFQIQVVT